MQGGLPATVPPGDLRTVDVVVPAFGRPDKLAAALASLLQQRFDRPTRCRVVVYDDGSAEPLRNALPAELLAEVAVVRGERNLGRAKARNAGAASGEAATIVFMDADCVAARSDLLEGHLRVLEAGGDVSIGLIWDRSSGFWGRYQRDVARRRLAAARRGAFAELTTANLAIRRSVFDAAGGFSEAYRVYGFEDRDLICRLLECGANIDVREELLALHEDRLSLADVGAKLRVASRSSAPVFFSRHPGTYRASPYGRIDPRLRGRWARMAAQLVAPLYAPAIRLGEKLIAAPFLPYPVKRSAVRAASALAVLRGALEDGDPAPRAARRVR